MGKLLVQIVALCLGLIVSAQAEPPVPSFDLQAPGPVEPFGFTYSNSIPESPQRPATAPASSSSSASRPIAQQVPVQDSYQPIPIAQQVPVQASYQPAPPAAYPSQNQQVYYETVPSSSNQYYHTYQPQPQIVYGPPTTTTTTPRPSVVYGPPSRFPQPIFVPARIPLRTTTQNPVYLPPSAPTTTTTTTTQRPPVVGYSYNRPQGPQITYGPTTARPVVSHHHQVSYHPQAAFAFVRPSRFSYIPNRFQYVPLTTSYGQW